MMMIQLRYLSYEAKTKLDIFEIFKDNKNDNFKRILSYLIKLWFVACGT